MSLSLKECVQEHSKARGNVRFLLYYLADRTADRDGYAYPSVDRLAKHLGLHKRNVQKAIERAEGLRELRVLPGGGRRRHNAYFVECGAPAAHANGGGSATVSRSEGVAMPAQSVAPPPRIGGASATQEEVGSSREEVIERNRHLLHDERADSAIRRAALKGLVSLGAATDEDRMVLGLVARRGV